jgi:putative ABC transport system substrate-binding protein
VIRLPVEVLVVPNTTTGLIAKEATSTMPIVVVGGGALLEFGLIASLARPGGNVTGIATLGPEINPKQLELLKEAVPEVTRVAVLRGLAPQERELQAMKVAAQSLGVELHLFEAHEPTAFDSTFAAMARAQAQALFVFADAFFRPYRQRIVDLAAQYHLPSICQGRAYAEAGCLMSYGFNQPDWGQRIAAYVDKILRGATPADLPVEQPMRFEFVINLKTAKALGMTMPPSLLLLADEVIQ